MKSAQTLREEYKRNKLETKISKERLNKRINEENKVQRLFFREENKRWMILMDIILIVIILSNYGALFITNAMVSKKASETNERVMYVEINPNVAESMNYEEHENSDLLFKQILYKSFFWGMVIFLYILMRVLASNNTALIVMALFLCMIGYLMMFDFINDLGYWVGSLIWG